MPPVSKGKARTRRAPATPERPRAARPSVLLVEDDRFLAGMYVTKLQLEGIHVRLARDGAEAWRELSNDPPGLVLLDVVLPKLSGFEVLERMRRDATLRSVPVILLTNLGQKEDLRRGKELGATEYLIKAHFLPSEVVDRVRALLGKKRRS